MIDMSNWHFTQGVGPQSLIEAGAIQPPTNVFFATHLDLLQHLARIMQPNYVCATENGGFA